MLDELEAKLDLGEPLTTVERQLARELEAIEALFDRGESVKPEPTFNSVESWAAMMRDFSGDETP
jgi:hypothetical protein